MVDKFGHVRADRVTYSVPTRYAYRPVWVKLYHDRVAVAAGTEVVARHVRAFRAGATVLDPFHVLPVLERKHRAVPEATALQDWPLAPVWQQVRTALRQQTRTPDQEWVRMLQSAGNLSRPGRRGSGRGRPRPDSPRRPRKEAAGSRHEPGLVRQTAPASTDPIGPQTQTLLEEVLRRENLRTALKRVQSNKGAPGVRSDSHAPRTVGQRPGYARLERRPTRPWP